MKLDLSKRFGIEPGKDPGIAKRDTSDTAGFKDKKAAQKILKQNLEDLFDLQYRLYAEDKQALLVVLQGIDAAGKDGTIRHVMTGLNPQGCPVNAFKQPSSEELDHDFLWRVHKAAPRRGEIGIFNRSHYEDVLIVRVHDLVPKKAWSKRYEQINRFERNLAESGTRILKFFLYISKDEQKERFQARLDDPTKNWKFSMGDVKERKHWDDYIEAYEEALRRCSKPWAPWFVIPSNKKWFRNLAVSQIILETLRDMNPKMPPPLKNPEDITFK